LCLVLWVHYIGSGIVGAAGAFLLVPIMLVVLKTPTRMTIASQCRNEYVIKQTLTTGGILLIPIVGRIRRSKDRRKWGESGGQSYLLKVEMII